MKIATPLFDYAEALKVAARVGFDPEAPGLARDLFEETQGHWSMPHGVTDEQARQAAYFIALGTFIFARWEDERIDPPQDLEEWRRHHARCVRDDSFFAVLGEDAVDPRWLDREGQQ